MIIEDFFGIIKKYFTDQLKRLNVVFLPTDNIFYFIRP